MRRDGFTLIEVLAVVGILGVLTALIVPVLARARAESRRVECSNNLAQLGKAMQMYVAEHQGTYPVMAARPTLNAGMARLRDTIITYAKDERIFHCSSDNQNFFANEGSSYEWNAVLNGRVQDGAIEDLLGSSKTPLMYDYENFHPDPGDGGFGGKNVVFCDGSVAH
jgi:prepilin-type N-terminal cleavage/methylation domain-containing protein/prepilin-type processing-associated H-X9-DG protein